MPNADIPVLILIPMQAAHLEQLRRRYRVHYAPNGPGDAAAWRPAARQVRGIVTNGSTGVSASLLGQLPSVEIITCFGAGYENVDRSAARARAVPVTHAPNLSDATVADHALALMLALARGVIPLDRAVRAGAWSGSRAARPTLHGRRLGLLGLGAIGLQVARRAQAFDMAIGYHTRRPRPDVPWPHHERLVDLARTSDFLVAACPGGQSTHHLIDAAVLGALGPEGFLINVARGSVVDTAALIAALDAGTIAGAGLDVVEGEPHMPPSLLRHDNLILTPHVAGRSPEVLSAQISSCLANLDAHFAGHAPPSPVPTGD